MCSPALITLLNRSSQLRIKCLIFSIENLFHLSKTLFTILLFEKAFSHHYKHKEPKHTEYFRLDSCQENWGKG